MDLGGPRKHALDRWAQILRAKVQLLGKKDIPGHARRHSVVSCAKMAEQIDLPLGSPSGGENPQFLPLFGLQHFVVSPVGSNLRKLNKTFPYPMVSKSFLYSNAFMAKLGAQTLTFKSVTNRQTDKQEKNSTLLTDPQRVQSEPHQTWDGDRGPRARSCASKTFGDPTHSFAARAALKIWGNQTSST